MPISFLLPPKDKLCLWELAKYEGGGGGGEAKTHIFVLKSLKQNIENWRGGGGNGGCADVRGKILITPPPPPYFPLHPSHTPKNILHSFSYYNYYNYLYFLLTAEAWSVSHLYRLYRHNHNNFIEVGWAHSRNLCPPLEKQYTTITIITYMPQWATVQ